MNKNYYSLLVFPNQSKLTKDKYLRVPLFSKGSLGLTFAKSNLINALKNLQKYKQYYFNVDSILTSLISMLRKKTPKTLLRQLAKFVGVKFFRASFLPIRHVMPSCKYPNRRLSIKFNRQKKIVRRNYKQHRKILKSKLLLERIEIAKSLSLYKTLKGKKMPLWKWVFKKEGKADIADGKKYYRRSLAVVRDFINLVHRVNGISVNSKKLVAKRVVNVAKATKKLSENKRKSFSKKVVIKYVYVKRKLPALFSVHSLNNNINICKKLLLNRGLKRLRSVIENNHTNYFKLELSHAKSRATENKKRQGYRFAYFKRRRKTRLVEIKEAVKYLNILKKRKLKNGVKLFNSLRCMTTQLIRFVKARQKFNIGIQSIMKFRRVNKQRILSNSAKNIVNLDKKKKRNRKIIKAMLIVKKIRRVFKRKLGRLNLEEDKSIKVKTDIKILKEITKAERKGHIITHKCARKRVSIRQINILWHELSPVIKAIKKLRLKKDKDSNKQNNQKSFDKKSFDKKSLKGMSHEQKRQNYYKTIYLPRLQAQGKVSQPTQHRI